MRAIHLAALDTTRPVLVLTRDPVRPYLSGVTVAPITSSARGLATEVPVGVRNGLDDECVVSCDSITTIPADALGKLVGQLLPGQERALAHAISHAFDLRAG